MDFAGVFEQTQCNAMDGSIAPSFVKEATRTIEMSKVIFVSLTPPEAHVGNLEITPKVTCAVPVCFQIVLRAAISIRQPRHGIVLVQMLRVGSQKFDRFGPQAGQCSWRVVDVDVEAIGFVVVLHVSEDIVVDITEKLDVRFHTPVVLSVLERWMMIEHATVPAAHLVV